MRKGRGLTAPALFMPNEFPRTPYAGSSVYEKASFTSSNCCCWGGAGTIYRMLGKSK
jgi:hypothetical protein